MLVQCEESGPESWIDPLPQDSWFARVCHQPHPMMAHDRYEKARPATQRANLHQNVSSRVLRAARYSVKSAI